MISFVEFNVANQGRRVSINVTQIVDVVEGDGSTDIMLSTSMSEGSDFGPVIITVEESYIEVMYQIRSAIECLKL